MRIARSLAFGQCGRLVASCFYSNTVSSSEGEARQILYRCHPMSVRGLAPGPLGSPTGQKLASDIYERGPKNNRNLNVARELEVVARCAARCRESTLL
jgi:hypothetical protein